MAIWGYEIYSFGKSLFIHYYSVLNFSVPGLESDDHFNTQIVLLMDCILIILDFVVFHSLKIYITHKKILFRRKKCLNFTWGSGGGGSGGGGHKFAILFFFSF